MLTNPPFAASADTTVFPAADIFAVQDCLNFLP
jgi:hypothetical protein